MKGKAVAIGTFDGVHRGHKSVLDTLVEVANTRGLEPVAITFDRHPLAHIAPERDPGSIISLEKKKKLLAHEGVTPMVIEFNEELRSKTAAEWMKVMHENMGVKTLVIGYDNTFGSDGVNLNVKDYERIGEENGIEVIVAPELKNISSSAVRKALKNGDVEKAAHMLGHDFSLSGTVVKGNGIGRNLGFPTANIVPDHSIILPKEGAYAAKVKLPDGSVHPAMVNIGSRPTLKRGDHILIEVNVVDWSGNLYDKKLTVSFRNRLRDEVEFDSINSLRNQLKNDQERVKELFKEETQQ